MGIFKKKIEERQVTSDEAILQGMIIGGELTIAQALSIPTLSSCVEFLSNTIASLPVKLYKEHNGEVVELLRDNRVKLLNDETGDTLDSFQMKKAFIVDLLIEGAGYIYINSDRNTVKSLHYVDKRSVFVQSTFDPIFKQNEIMINGQTYRDFEFIKVLRKTKDGATGIGVIEENKQVLSVSYNTLVFENNMVRNGGNKKGFLKSSKKLSQEGLDALKIAWKALYNNNRDNMMILNDGVDFQESSNSSVEMQLKENKLTNSELISSIFNLSLKVIAGTASESEYITAIKTAVMPIVNMFAVALNRDMLLESEKGEIYFAFDLKELMKADIEKRYKAYEVAIRNKILTVNEVRYEEDKPPIEALNDVLVLGLNDVLYNTKTGTVYTPNTDKTSEMNNKNTEKDLLLSEIRGIIETRYSPNQPRTKDGKFSGYTGNGGGIIKLKNSEFKNGLPIQGQSNTTVDKVDDNGKTLQRRIYGTDGKAKIDFDTTDHNFPFKHPTGAHKHEFDYSKKNPHGKPLKLTNQELEDNKDIIKRGVNYND